MSYILDALNKSEKERARRRAPDLSSLQKADQRDGFGARHFLAILVFLVALNSFGVWYFFGERIMPPPTPAAPAMTTDIPSGMSATESPDSAPVPVEQSAPSTPPVAIGDLPSGIRNRLPEVTVTAHIYADDRDLRLVKIEGIDRREGDQVQAGLRLVEITETGVVMEFEGTRYRLDIVEQWQLY